MFDEHFVDEKDRSRVIDLFRLIAIMCVILVHIPYKFTISGTATGPGDYMLLLMSLPLSEQTVIFFKYGLGRVASPALSLVSAWFLLRTIDKKSFRTIVVSKAQNLLIPYVFWGLLYAIFFLVIMWTTGRDGYHFRGNIPEVLWKSTFNLMNWPFNGPLHYLIDLFEIAVCYALFHRYLQRNRGLLLVLTACVPWILSYLGHSQSWLGDNKLSLLPRVDLTFYFLIGVLTYPMHQRLFSSNVVKLFGNIPLVLVLVVLVILCSKFIYFYNEVLTPAATPENILYLYVNLFIRSIASVLVFATAVNIYKTFRLSISRKVVFRAFCSHALLIWIINACVNNVINDNHLLLRYVVVFVLTMVVAWGMSKVMDRIHSATQFSLFRYI